MQEQTESSQTPAILIKTGKKLKEIPSDEEMIRYADLSDNKISEPYFGEKYDNISSLFLSSNYISALHHVNLSSLKCLSLDYCKVKSLKGFTSLQKLQRLSLRGNSLKSYEHFPILPRLTKIDLRDNDRDFNRIYTMTVVASVHIASVDGVAVTKEEYLKAFSFPPIVGYSLRKGRDPAQHKNDYEFSHSFLSTEQPLIFRNMGTFSVLKTPRENVEIVKWYQSTEEDDKWEDLDCTSKTITITPIMCLKLIKCESIVGDETYTSYSNCILDNTLKGIILPNVQVPIIPQKPQVGNLISLDFDPPYPYTSYWTVNGEKIEGDSNAFVVPFEAESGSIELHIKPYSFVFPDIDFEELVVKSEVPKIQDAILLSFSIPDEMVEDEPFVISYETFPPNQKVRFIIEGSRSLNSEFKMIAKLHGGSNEYTPSSNDVDHYIRATTTFGERLYSAYSLNKVKKKPPKILQGMIAGATEANHPLLALVTFNAGSSYPLTFSWFALKNDVKTSIKSNSQVFTPSSKYVGSIIGVTITALVNGEEQYFDIYAHSEIVSSPQLLEIPGVESPIQDNKITMIQSGTWCISDFESKDGFKSISEGETYVPQESEIGSYLRFVSEGIDIILGKVAATKSPLKSVDIENPTNTAGSTLSIAVTFYPGREQEYDISWIRCSRDSPDTVVQEGGKEYVLTFNDIGSKIKARASCAGHVRDSDPTNIIKTGMYHTKAIIGEPLVLQTLSLSSIPPKSKVKWYHDNNETPVCVSKTLPLKYVDVGHIIKVVVSTKSEEYTESIDEPVKNAPVYEGQTLALTDLFHHDVDQNYGYMWFRFDFSTNEWTQVGSSNSYKVSVTDVESVIRVVCFEISAEGQKGKETFADVSMIIGSDKAEQKPTIVRTTHGHLKLVGNFGESRIKQMKFVWRRWKHGKCEEIKGFNDQKIVPLPSMVGCDIDGGYCFLPSTDFYWSEKRHIDYALPIPQAELEESGPLIEGCKLKANVHRVPKLTPHFNWKRWNGEAFSDLGNNDNDSYYVQQDDVDCYVCCDVFFADQNGIHSANLTIETTEPISPSNVVLIVGPTICGETLTAATGDDFFKKQCRIIWQRGNENEWYDVGKKISYRLSCEDAGQMVRVIASNQVEERISAEVGPIEHDQQIINKANAFMKSANFKFKGTDNDGKTWSIDAAPTTITIRSKGVAKTLQWKSIRINSMGKRIELNAGQSLRLELIPSMTTDTSLDAARIRDLCVITLNMFRERGIQAKKKI